MSHYKYPKTFHFPWSESNTSDDVWHTATDFFEGKKVVVTEKMDGENTSMYQDHIHARSIDSKHHASRSMVKALHAQIKHEIPGNFRICGENLFAWHSIFYTELPSHFMVFGIYDSKNNCLPWNDVLEWCDMLGLATVPTLYKGEWDESKIRSMWQGKGTYPTFEAIDPEIQFPKYPDDFEPCVAEGYVVRLADGFSYNDHAKATAKYVRPHHVKTSQYWMLRAPFPNLLRQD